MGIDMLSDERIVAGAARLEHAADDRALGTANALLGGMDSTRSIATTGLICPSEENEDRRLRSARWRLAMLAMPPRRRSVKDLPGPGVDPQAVHDLQVRSSRAAGRADRAGRCGEPIAVGAVGRGTVLASALALVAGMASERRPGLVPAVLAVLSKSATHAVGERWQRIAVPLLKRVGGEGDPGATTKVGEDGDLVH